MSSDIVDRPVDVSGAQPLLPRGGRADCGRPALQHGLGRLDVAAKGSELVLVKLCATFEVARARLVGRRDTPKVIQEPSLLDTAKLVGPRDGAQHFAVSTQDGATHRALDAQAFDLPNRTASEPAGNQRDNPRDKGIRDGHWHRGVQTRLGGTARSLADRQTDCRKRYRPGVEEPGRYASQQVATASPAPDATELLPSLDQGC